MAISFNDIGNDIRTPFIFAEFDATKAQQGSSTMPYKVLVIGQKNGGTADALTLARFTSPAQVKKAHGAGSMLHRMSEIWNRNNDTTETLYIGLEDSAAGQAATGNLTFAGTAVNGGTVALYLGGRRIRVAVTPAMTPENLAADMAEAVNALELSPVTALAGDGGKITFQAKHKGVCGNNIIILAGYHPDEELPTGLTITTQGQAGTPTICASPNTCEEGAAAVAAIAAKYGAIDPARPFQTLPAKGLLPPRECIGIRLAGGSGNPDLAEVWAAIGDVHYHVIVLPYTDAANLMSVKEELARRRGPMVMKGAVAFGATNGSLSEQGTLGDTHNSENLCITGLGGPFERRERNLLLWDGIATLYEDADGQMCVERLITTYKVNSWGVEDKAYLDVETLLTLEYLRYDFRAYLSRRYPRHKLANDGTRYGKGQAIVTPKIIKAECIAWFGMMENKGLVENVDQFKIDLIVERNADDPCRLDIYLPPDLVNQWRVGAVQIGFRL